MRIDSHQASAEEVAVKRSTAALELANECLNVRGNF